MEKIAYELKDLLQKKTDLYKDLIRVLEEDRDIIGSMKPNALWDTVSRKKKLVSEIESIRKRLRGMFDDHLRQRSPEAARFDISLLIRVLPVPESLRPELMAMATGLTLLKHEARQIALANRRNIDDCLSVFSGAINAIVGASNDRRYTGTGSVVNRSSSNRMIRAEV